ncbi:MAG: hypothetical protein RJA69_1620 [Pseudomonadota bacterium]|jgi:hypothetical protein
MNPQEVQAYVRAAAQLLDVPMTDERCERVADHLGRTVQMARLLEEFALHEHVEVAELFIPAPFPVDGA